MRGVVGPAAGREVCGAAIGDCRVAPADGVVAVGWAAGVLDEAGDWAAGWAGSGWVMSAEPDGFCSSCQPR